jgi:hypothetical protein
MFGSSSQDNQKPHAWGRKTGIESLTLGRTQGVGPIHPLDVSNDGKTPAQDVFVHNATNAQSCPMASFVQTANYEIRLLSHVLTESQP